MGQIEGRWNRNNRYKREYIDQGKMHGGDATVTPTVVLDKCD